MRRLLAITIAALIAVFFLFIPSPLMAAFEVAPDAEFVKSSAPWKPGADISLTVEDGSGVVFTDSQTADAGGDFLFDLYPLFDLQRGHVVTVSDGVQTKTHTVRNLFVDGIDLSADTVAGRAASGSDVDVRVYSNGSLSVTADGFGIWAADFSGMIDLTSHAVGDARQTDVDGDATLVLWQAGPVAVDIDIKPGSDPNSLNNDGHGKIPVAILTTDIFDAATVDPFTLTLDGAAVNLRGKSGIAGGLEDVDGDGDLDLVVQFEDVAGTYSPGESVATLSGQTYDGVLIEGSDTILIVPLE